MSHQPSVASFFGKRKRIVTEDIYRNKILRTDSDVNLLDGKPAAAECPELKPCGKTPENNISAKLKTETVRKVKGGGSKVIEVNKEKPKIQVDIRDALNKCQEKASRSNFTSPIRFELLGSLSPSKKCSEKVELNNELSSLKAETRVKATGNFKTNASSISIVDDKEKAKECSTEDIIKSAQQLVSKIRETQKKLAIEPNQKKELSLSDIKDKIKRSSKLSELKKSINKINEHAEELIKLEKNKLTGAQPKLSKFKTIELEVPVSPTKNALYSPVKQQPKSPYKPAYERFAGLVDASPLPLPFSFQKLYNLFKAVDTICSMMINRGEVITFSKLKPAVEEMTRNNFTLRHLGQMATVLPSAFSFHQEKLRNFGSTSKVDKYELVITPTFPSNTRNLWDRTSIEEDDVFRQADRSVMTPKVIKARRESFYDSLLERTKDCHEKFLKTLDPPITINKDDLKRWHPNFMLDMIPDVLPQELPQPPSDQRPSSAKEILERAKDFLSSNTRLHKALEAAAGSSEVSDDPASKVSPEIRQKVDARLNNPLKGIPKSLLEKVRARQAAKALDAMRTSPEEEKRALMYSRLPDIARIVRTVFINEQKAVLLLETVLEKVQFSYNRNLSLHEVEAHIRLLTQKLPEWLSIVRIRQTEYLKISRGTDVSSVMNNLRKIVEDKKRETTGIPEI